MSFYRTAPASPPAPPPRKQLARPGVPAIILGLSAALHVGALVVAARADRDQPAPPPQPKTHVVRVLHGQALASGESGGELRLEGYGEAEVRERE